LETLITHERGGPKQSRRVLEAPITHEHGGP
jgi:hypothetical protein